MMCSQITYENRSTAIEKRFAFEPVAAAIIDIAVIVVDVLVSLFKFVVIAVVFVVFVLAVSLLSKVLSLKPGVGQYIAIHATLTARDPCYFYPSGPFTCIFSKHLPKYFAVLAVTNTGCCVGPQNKIGHHVGCRFPC